jgi:hypothetical protein
MQGKRTYAPMPAKAFACRKILETQQWPKSRQDIGENFGRNPAGGFGAAFLPVKTLELVGQYHTCNHQSRRQRDLERITFDMARYGTDERETGLSIVSCGG